MLITKPQSIRARRRLQRAFSARAAIRHPNVVQATAHKKRDGLVVILGPSGYPRLSELLGCLEPTECARIVRGACRGVQATTDAGLTPRDVSPEQIHVDPVLGGVVADTALPREVVPLAPTDRDPYLAYRSPEELDGLRVDARSSVYSLGAVLFAALTGRPPFEGLWSRVYLGHTAEPRPRVGAHRKGVPKKIEAVVRRAMTVNPADRYAAPAELADALESAAGLSPLPEPEPAGDGARSSAAPALNVPWGGFRAARELMRALTANPVPAMAQAHPSDAAECETGANSEEHARSKAANGRPAVSRSANGKPSRRTAVSPPTQPGTGELDGSPAAAASQAAGLGGAATRVGNTMLLGAIDVRDVVTSTLRSLADSAQSRPASHPAAQRLRGERRRARPSATTRRIPPPRHLKPPERRPPSGGRSEGAVRRHPASTWMAVALCALVGVIGGAAALTPSDRSDPEMGGPASVRHASTPEGDPAPVVDPKPRRPDAREVIRNLIKARFLARRRLARAKTADDQRVAARTLQVHFRWAAWQIERTGMRPERRAALVQALHATDTAYAQLATATTAGDQWAYDQARSAVLAGEAAVWDAAPPPR